MACGLLLLPAGAAALWPRRLMPAPRRSSAAKEQPHRVFDWKLHFGAAESHRSRSLVRCSCSCSSLQVAELSRPANVSSAHSDLSMTRRMDSVPGAFVVISGYWIGPDVDDGGGNVEAMLQRIV
ncbi:hypothetical protein ACP70R_004938 [Stipagrostis hirtigluma subsp. patula]